MNFVIAIMGTANAIITTLGYYLIKKRIEAQRETWKSVESLKKSKQRAQHYSTATECLSTFVKVAACIYCPFAISYWIYTVQSLMGFIEPITAFMLAITANSSGWANSLGYVYNERLKSENKKSLIPATTTCANTGVIFSDQVSVSSNNFNN